MDTIILTDDLVIGRGSRRDVYRHPDDPTKCIKVLQKAPTASIKEHKREFQFFKKLKKNYDYIPNFYCKTSTNRGEGLVFDYISTDVQNQSAKTLNCYKNDGLEVLTNIYEAILELKTKMINDKIVLYDFSLRNLIYKSEEKQIFIIDGLSKAHFFNIYSYVKILNRKRIERKILNWAESLIKNEHPALYEKMILDNLSNHRFSLKCWTK